MRRAAWGGGKPGHISAFPYHRDRKASAKPHTYQQIVFPFKYFVTGWTRTRTEEVCSSVVKYSTSTDWAIPAYKTFNQSYSEIFKHYSVIMTFTQQLWWIQSFTQWCIQCLNQSDAFKHSINDSDLFKHSLRHSGVFTGPDSSVGRVSTLQCRATTGRSSVGIMWLGVVSCQVAGAWYFSEAAL